MDASSGVFVETGSQVSQGIVRDGIKAAEVWYRVATYTNERSGSRRKGTYARVRPHRYTYGIYWNTVANVDASDSRCRCRGKIIARDQRLVACRLYRMAVTRPGSGAAVTVSPSLDADLLGCINRIRDKEGKESIKQSCRVCTGTHSKFPVPIGTVR